MEDWEVAELVDDSCKAEEEDADVVDLVADSGDEEGRVSRAGARSRKPRKPRQPRKPKPSRSDWHDLEPLPVDARLMDEAECAEELGDEMLPCKVCGAGGFNGWSLGFLWEVALFLAAAERFV